MDNVQVPVIVEYPLLPIVKKTARFPQSIRQFQLQTKLNKKQNVSDTIRVGKKEKLPQTS